MILIYDIKSTKAEEFFTWYTSYAEFKIKNGVEMYFNANCGKKHCRIRR